MGFTKYDRYRALQTDLFSYLVEQGYTPKRVGANEYKFPEIGDSFQVNTEKNVYVWFSHGEQGGRGIKALMEAFNMTEEEAIHALLKGDLHREEAKDSASKSTQPSKAIMPEEYKDGWKNLYAYLIKARKLSPDIVQEFVDKKLIYPTKSKNGFVNIVFAHKQLRGFTGADIEGTHSSIRFKGCIPHADNDLGFTYKRGNLQKIFLFEAAIDLMSYLDIHKDENNALFVSMGGLKRNIADHYINNSQNLPVISCVDNDEGSMGELGKGQEFNALYAGCDNFTVNTECKDYGVKDFNELLCELKEDANLRSQCTKVYDWCSSVDKGVVTQQQQHQQQHRKTDVAL